MDSFTAQLGLEEDSSSNVSTPPSSQEDSAAKRPSLSPFVKVQEENSTLRDQLLGLIQEHQAQNARQREESLEQQRQMERQFVVQIAEHCAQKEMMERQLAQEKEQADRQKQQADHQLAQQKEMMERQLAQQEKITDLIQSKLGDWSKNDDIASDTILVTWNGEGDPSNPLNFALYRKWTITVLLSFGGLICLMSSTMLAPALIDIAHELDISQASANMTLSIFVLAFAFGPM
ncbi:hypothetical protein LTR74_017407 [Friedmanniomyces endolithicus]|nr:hypothetical protein LTR74_017407 [Friedmanniomyces endolithicus]